MLVPELDVRRKLPDDADLERMAEQRILVQRGLYISRTGVYKALPEDAPGVGWEGDDRPPVPVERAHDSTGEPILLHLPDR